MTEREIERERLIELLNKKYDHFCDQCGVNKDSHYIDSLADYLLANGVIVPLCKVGDVVYRISTKSCAKMKYIQKTKVSRIAIDNNGTWIFCECNPIAKCVFGKTVFLTKEEAEKALKGGVE